MKSDLLDSQLFDMFTKAGRQIIGLKWCAVVLRKYIVVVVVVLMFFYYLYLPSLFIEYYFHYQRRHDQHTL